VARVRIRETHTVPLWRNMKQRVYLEDVGLGKRIILKWILKG
jgi:LEA14-like dessication related protein